MEIITKEKYIQAVADADMRLTTYAEGDDIKLYDSFSVGNFPLSFDTTKIREITKAEDEEYIAARDAAIEEEMSDDSAE